MLRTGEYCTPVLYILVIRIRNFCCTFKLPRFFVSDSSTVLLLLTAATIIICVIFHERSTPLRCWVKAKTFPLEMEASLDVAYGKSQSSGKNPAVDGLMKTLNTVSVRVHEAQEEGSPVTDMEIIDLLANLDITPGGHADESAKQKAQAWATIEDQEDVVEAMKSDDAEYLMKALAGIHIEEEESSDGEEDGSDDGSTGGGGSGPPSYANLSPHFGTLEEYASGCGLTEASHFLKKARMVMIEAHASK